MTRYRVFAYFTTLVGFALSFFYLISHHVQAAYAYQTAKYGSTTIQEGSFWMTANGEPFLYPGVVLTIIGIAMVIHEGIAAGKASQRLNAEDATQ